MEIEYFDHISGKNLKVKTNIKVAHLINEEKQKFKYLPAKKVKRLSKNKRERYYQQKFEREQISLDYLISRGFQPMDNFDINSEISKIYKEDKFFKSAGYKNFRMSLKKEFRVIIDKLSAQQKKVLCLRLLKNMSLSQIASELNISKGTVQNYISNAYKDIKFFLNKNISTKDKLKKERRMQVAQSRVNVVNK